MADNQLCAIQMALGKFILFHSFKNAIFFAVRKYFETKQIVRMNDWQWMGASNQNPPPFDGKFWPNQQKQTPRIDTKHLLILSKQSSSF